MVSLHASSSLSCSSYYASRRINAAIHVPKLSFPALRVPLKRNVIEEVLTLKDGFRNVVLPVPVDPKKIIISTTESESVPIEVKEMYVLLEVVSDRVAMHDNVGEQRNNWNTLLLNSINMITLTATTTSALAAAASSSGASHLALNVSSTLLFSAATAMLLIMNKIQPSQLAEEQRNASRLFRQLQASIETLLALKTPSQEDVNETMEKILALDTAYPLPLLGTMIEKFPHTFQTSAWWPQLSGNKMEQEISLLRADHDDDDNNGWSDELEQDLRQVVEVLRSKDNEEYMRLGNLALKINKVLAISGPLLSGIAAVGSAFIGSSHGSFAPVVAVAAGALAGTVNAVEHGGQVGMVVEMYRCCGGCLRMLGDAIESTLEERDLKKRENGEVFERKVALQLGRSLSELRELASKDTTDEYASKLF